MTWDQILYNVIVPVGAAVVLGLGGIWAAKWLGKDWSEHFNRK